MISALCSRDLVPTRCVWTWRRVAETREGSFERNEMPKILCFERVRAPPCRVCSRCVSGAVDYSCELVPPMACTDGGPWPCIESGCAAPSISCADLAGLGACADTFADWWETPPNGTSHLRIDKKCAWSCGRSPKALPPRHSTTACSDGGPWPCTEEGCPSPSMNCTALAALHFSVCLSTFGDVWKTPPDNISNVRIKDKCARSCGRCISPVDVERLEVDAEQCQAAAKADARTPSLAVLILSTPTAEGEVARAFVRQAWAHALPSRPSAARFWFVLGGSEGPARADGGAAERARVAAYGARIL